MMMMTALRAKNKLGIVTTKFMEPDNNTATQALWERTNDMIISKILNTGKHPISKDLNFVH